MTLLKANPFFQVPRTCAVTSEGIVDLPIFYYDTTAVYAFFLADRTRIDRELAGTALASGLHVGAKSLVVLACYEYRDTSVGVYNEVGLAAAVSLEPSVSPLAGWRDLLRASPDERHNGLHVLDLPVTTPQANAAGREIWGFPKFVTTIPFNMQKREFFCAVDDPVGAGEIMRLEGKMGVSLPAQPVSLTLYTLLNRQMLRTHVNARGRSWMAAPGSVRLNVGNSEHAMAERLRRLGLDGAKPFALMWSTAFQSRLNAGCPVEG